MTKIIISFIFFAIALGLIFGFVKPQYDAAEIINSEIAQYEKALSKAKEIQTLKRSLLSKYNLFEGNSRKLEKLLPNNVDNVRLVLDIDGIATNRGIRIGSVKVQKPKKKVNGQGAGVGFADAAQGAQPYQTITLEFAAVATYPQFKDFLQDLEHSLRIVDLVSLEVVKAQIARKPQFDKKGKRIAREPEPEKYKFTVGIRTYWLK